MREIPPEEAAASYGVTTLHQQMPNGELRFRLKKDGGTAYIRTEASNSGAWQKSHFHQKVQETYIVQSGWIAYATKGEGRLRIEVYRERELFTTQPGVIHNIYMAQNSVIHTVKHGACQDEDRTSNQETEEFDQWVECLTDEISILDLNKRNNINVDQTQGKQTYNAVYRHYDDLIWRAPL